MQTNPTRWIWAGMWKVLSWKYWKIADKWWEISRPRLKRKWESRRVNKLRRYIYFEGICLCKKFWNFTWMAYLGVKVRSQEPRRIWWSRSHSKLGQRPCLGVAVNSQRKNYSWNCHDFKTDFIQRNAHDRLFCSRGEIGLGSRHNKGKLEFYS